MNRIKRYLAVIVVHEERCHSEIALTIPRRSSVNTVELVYIHLSCLLFRYLRKDNLQHCVPSNVSSGLATRPLSYVYVNNVADKSRPTNKSLPTGELLDGKESYKQIVSYFTTNTMSPDEIHKLGFKMLNELYPQVGGVINL